ncbi:MAG: hypothetical protein LW832_05400 [Parachlamydia sp.]|nr:hypothetical protein [Parachlamydia sp.]
MQTYILTDFERFTLTEPFLRSFSAFNNSSYAISGTLLSRIGGVAALPFVSLAEGFLHGTIFLGKSAIGLPFSVYNFYASSFRSKNDRVRVDLEFSSAFIHLIRTVESLFHAALLPILCAINPDKAHAFVNARNWPFTLPEWKIIRERDQVERFELNLRNERGEGEPGPLESEIQRLNDQIREKERKIVAYEQDKQAHIGVLLELNRVIEQKDQKIREQDDSHELIAVELESAKKALKEQENSSRVEIELEQRKLQNLTDQEANRSVVADLQTELSSKESELSDVKVALADERQRLERLEIQHQLVNKYLSRYKSQNAELKIKIEELENLNGQETT